jgi:hypothetical protein
MIYSFYIYKKLYFLLRNSLYIWICNNKYKGLTFVCLRVSSKFKKNSDKMNTNDFRLIQVIENFDKVIQKDILLFEFSPVDYQNSGYQFSPDSENNIFIVCENSSDIENYYMSQKDEIISIELDDFDLVLIKNNEEIKKTYLEKNYSRIRTKRIFWHGDAIKDIESDKQIAFKFSHCQDATFDYGKNYTEFNDDVIPSTYAEMDIKEEINYLVIDKQTVAFCFQNRNGVFTRIKGKIQRIDSDEFGRIKKIETLSNWALTDNEIVIYEFDNNPIKFFEKSERNATVTVRGRKSQPSIRVQWSLLFGENLGIVQFT